MESSNYCTYKIISEQSFLKAFLKEVLNFTSPKNFIEFFLHVERIFCIHISHITNITLFFVKNKIIILFIMLIEVVLLIAEGIMITGLIGFEICVFYGIYKCCESFNNSRCSKCNSQY